MHNDNLLGTMKSMNTFFYLPVALAVSTSSSGLEPKYVPKCAPNDDRMNFPTSTDYAEAISKYCKMHTYNDKMRYVAPYGTENITVDVPTMDGKLRPLTITTYVEDLKPKKNPPVFGFNEKDCEIQFTTAFEGDDIYKPCKKIVDGKEIVVVKQFKSRFRTNGYAIVYYRADLG